MREVNITEVLMKEKDDRFPDFSKRFPEVMEWKWNGIERWHFIMLDDDPARCFFKRGYSAQEEIELCFAEIYQCIAEKKFEKLLLLVTYYGVLPKEELKQKLNGSIYLPCRFDHISPTENYYLAFSDQLEKYYRMLTGATPAEALIFRRDINKKNRTTIQKAKEIMVDEHCSFYDLLSLKSFYAEGPFFLTPNYYGARLLHKSLSRQ
jgi:hypothetical protein